MKEVGFWLAFGLSLAFVGLATTGQAGRARPNAPTAART